MNPSRATHATQTFRTESVSEALSPLDTEARTREDAHQGATVHGLDDDLEEIIKMRQLLEPLLAQMAALHIREEHFAEAEELWRRMEKHDDPLEWSQNHRRFHELIATAAQSPRMEAIANSLRDNSAVFFQWYLMAHPQRAIAANADHRDLIDALRAGAGDLAAAIQAAHLREPHESFRQRDDL